MRSSSVFVFVAIAVASLAGCAPPEINHGDVVNGIADEFYTLTVDSRPEYAYFWGLEVTSHDGLSDNSPAALAAAQLVEDSLLAEIETVDVESLVGTPEWIAAQLLRQELTSSVRNRICRSELWGVNQMNGWHLVYSQIAELQPVDTPEQRAQALDRWSKFPAYVDQEIANLQQGIAEGYSAPKAVVSRVIDQLDGLLGLAVESSPFASPAKRSDDAEFSESVLTLVADSINPALLRVREYLTGDYMLAAREDLSITANPDGAECYEALLFSYTTIDRSGADVYELGRQTVASNRAKVVEIGKDVYGTEEFADIIVAAKSDPADRFASKEELLKFARDAVDRAGAAMPDWVGIMPTRAVEVVPFPEHEEGTGRSAHYRRGTDERPAEYRIPLFQPEEQSRGNVEATAFHEAWPGHHLQIATASEGAAAKLHPVTELIGFSGPTEGWARYSEALAEEMGLYETTTGPILRRAWPATGMVVDPGIHLFGWTREQAEAYMNETGRFPASQADDVVDRIAILPGQLTSYDSGGLEIFALRRQSEEALGDRFDIRAFHDRVLENGSIPLGALRQHIEAWIADRLADSE